VKRLKVLVQLVFLLLISPHLADAGVSVSLKVDRSKASLADSIRMVLTVSGSQEKKSAPVIHGLEVFAVTQGGTSSRLEIVDGQVNAGIDYVYYLQPNKTGSFQIGPAEVTVGGKTYKSNKVQLTVTKSVESAEKRKGPLFLSAEISSSQVYLEEQAIYTLRLYYRTKVSDISLNLPESEHLTFKQLGKPVQYQSVHDGVNYQVLEVKYALISAKDGNYNIGPARMNLTAYQASRRSRRSVFDDPFFNSPFSVFSRGRPVALTSESLELRILPLPTEGRPSDFSGLVGSFKIQSTVEPSTIKANESATLTIHLSGRGNVNRLPDLQVPRLDNIKVYVDQPTLQIEPDEDGLSGWKTMKWALVPEKEGRYIIPQLGVSFFDPAKQTYQVAKTSPHNLIVLPGEGREFQASVGGKLEGKPTAPTKQEVKELGRDILPIHTSMKYLTKAERRRPNGVVSLLLLTVPIFLYVTAFLGTRLRRKSSEISASAIAKKAAKTLSKRCRRGGLTCEQLTLYIKDYLNDRFTLALGAVTADEAAELLEANGVSVETVAKLRNILRRLEDEVFTGRGQMGSEMGEEISTVIKQIEKEVR
jgi:hypothetical protein